jgi:hypothetical protein
MILLLLHLCQCIIMVAYILWDALLGEAGSFMVDVLSVGEHVLVAEVQRAARVEDVEEDVAAADAEVDAVEGAEVKYVDKHSITGQLLNECPRILSLFLYYDQ